jgi:hypothetical protein
MPFLLLLVSSALYQSARTSYFKLVQSWTRSNGPPVYEDATEKLLAVVCTTKHALHVADSPRLGLDAKYSISVCVLSLVFQ